MTTSAPVEKVSQDGLKQFKDRYATLIKENQDLSKDQSKVTALKLQRQKL